MQLPPGQTIHCLERFPLCNATSGFLETRSEWDLYTSHPLFGVHVPVRVRVLSSRPDNDALRAPAFEKNTQKGNLIEMAEGATTLKGLRAQMGKKNPDSRDELLFVLGGFM